MTARKMSIYVDDETDKWMKERKEFKKSFSQMFKDSVRKEIGMTKELNEEMDKLPTPDNMSELGDAIPVVQDVTELNEEMEETLKFKDHLEEIGDTLKDNLQAAKELNEELQEIKKLKAQG